MDFGAAVIRKMRELKQGKVLSTVYPPLDIAVEFAIEDEEITLVKRADGSRGACVGKASRTCTAGRSACMGRSLCFAGSANTTGPWRCSTPNKWRLLLGSKPWHIIVPVSASGMSGLALDNPVVLQRMDS